MRIARVFPRRTNASPDDAYAFFGEPGFPETMPPIDAVHVSVTFTYDLKRAEELAASWGRFYPVEIGGPATGAPGGEFVPGVYLQHGYVITSRGCPNQCWHCDVWRREGRQVRELPIRDGWNVLDDNLLACSEEHIRAVFAMLKRQNRRAEFTGGLEAARLKPWHADLILDLKPNQVFFAYDTPDDRDPLLAAGRMMVDAGFRTAGHRMRCYVLCGYPRDTMSDADRRMRETIAAGFFPMAMLWRDRSGRRDVAWARFQREWARPEIVATKARESKE